LAQLVLQVPLVLMVQLDRLVLPEIPDQLALKERQVLMVPLVLRVPLVR
jgi:hypothetical protein